MLGLASIAHAASSLAAERGWLPVIALAGARDPARAITTLREVTRLWEVARHHTETDAATRDFLNRATSSLQDFNLRRLYDLLPEKDGHFHQLSVSAAFSRQRYLVGRTSVPHFEVGPSGTRQTMGDASLVLRTAPVTARDGDTNYLMQGRAGIVVGPIGWPTVIDGAQQFLQLLAHASEDPGARPTEALRHTVLARNPKLGTEDIEPIATLWEAYPRMARLLSSLGGVDDLVAPEAKSAPGVKHLLAVLHLDPKRMQGHYPELADYLEDLDKLLEADLRWLDSHDQTLATLHLDSRHLTARVELYEKDGLLVPSRRNSPLAEQHLDTKPGVFRYNVRASANLRVLGVGTQLRSARVDFEHERTERGMELRAHMKQVPTVNVTGAALGFVPTGLIDLVIPGDIQGLFEKSLEIACNGNSGKGVELKVRYDQRPEGNATLDGAITLEAIDNFLVKLGVGFFSDHLMPDDDVRTDVARLLNDVQSAFSADLERYARTQATTTR